jgi:hypothetical protein
MDETDKALIYFTLVFIIIAIGIISGVVTKHIEKKSLDDENISNKTSCYYYVPEFNVYMYEKDGTLYQSQDCIQWKELDKRWK